MSGGSPCGARIRVMRIIARLNVGGPAIHATLLNESLDAARYDCVLVCGDVEPGEGDYLTLHGKAEKRLVRLPALGREIRGLRDVSALARLVRLMREWKPDIVHTHTAKAGALGRVAARITGVPIVVHTYHGHVFHGYFSRPAVRVFLWIERVLGRFSSRLLAVSPAVRAELLRLRVAAPEKLMVVPLGLPLERFLHAAELRGELRKELGLDPAAPLVGIVARLVPIKAHDVFLNAAAIVSAAMPAAHFLIVGDGERRDELEKLAASLGIADRVHFLGWRSDLDRVYADLDVVALTSENEGSPVSIIEAMVSQCAVVSTRVGGVPDLIQDGVNGLLVSPGSPETFAGAVGRLLSDHALRRSLGAAARSSVYPAYSATRLVNDMDRLYSSLVAARTT